MMSSSRAEEIVDGDAALEVAALLIDVQYELVCRNADARDLLAVTFDRAADRIEIAMRSRPLGEDYPDLTTVLIEIARACATEAVAASQFRRILFSEEEITLEVVDAWDQLVAYVFVIRPAVLNS